MNWSPRVSVREAIRNKKGKLKVNNRFIGALVPTRLGENQTVSVEGDPIHVEARLEHPVKSGVARGRTIHSTFRTTTRSGAFRSTTTAGCSSS